MIEDDEDLPLEAQPGLMHGRGHVARRGCTCAACAVWRTDHAFAIDAEAKAQEALAAKRESGPSRKPSGDAYFEHCRWWYEAHVPYVAALPGRCRPGAAVTVVTDSTNRRREVVVQRRVGQRHLRGVEVELWSPRRRGNS